MHEITEKEIQQILFAGEGRDIEYKPAFFWDDEDKWVRYEVTKSVIAMSNTRGGGKIIIGINQKGDGKCDFVGVANEHISRFDRDQEKIQSIINSYCSEPPIFLIKKSPPIKTNNNEVRFLIFEVLEAPIYPVMTVSSAVYKKENVVKVDHIIDKDALYIRSLKAPWSSMKANSFEMREVVSLAADKFRNDLVSRGWTPPNMGKLPDFKAERQTYD